jgi:hypothetical protein
MSRSRRRRRCQPAKKKACARTAHAAVAASRDASPAGRDPSERRRRIEKTRAPVATRPRGEERVKAALSRIASQFS